jgi:putative OPT family oligopeptide transporter
LTDTARSEPRRVELTLRGLLIGVIITLAFTAANVYAGLKVALTFATSIPAAVISMAVLRAFTKNSTVWENNIVQTVASSAGTLASVVFVLPGLLMVGWWTGIPFWQSFAVCAIGGVLGVMYTIPLRRALVTTSTLPYPEGKAAAEVLKVGMASRDEDAGGEGKAGFMALLWGAIVSAFVPLLVGVRVFAGEVSYYFRPTSSTATGLGGSISMLLVGVGHLMGVAVGIAMAVGLAVTWGGLVPWMEQAHPELLAKSAEEAANAVWTAAGGNPGARFVGAGTIIAAALWSLFKLAKPVWTGLLSAIAASAAERRGEGALPRTEQDMPIWIVGLISLATLVPMAWLLHVFLQNPAAASMTGIQIPLLVAGLLYIVVIGFAVAAVCGYMAGLIGSSNSPVSGLAILSVLGATLLLMAVGAAAARAGDTRPLVAYSLMVTSILLTVATIANDNLQDLKTGQLVDATPWKQQFALLIGVLAGSVVIPPVLQLLAKAYGFQGMPGAGPNALAAPQAGLISTIAQKVFDGTMPWNLIGLGAVIGVVLVIIDEGLRGSSKGRFSLPPLGAALAMYLPSAVTVPVIIGSVLGWAYDRFLASENRPHSRVARQLGVLLASGLVVGESLMAVGVAGLTVAAGDKAGPDGPLALLGHDPTMGHSVIIAAVAFVVVLLGLYGWVNGLAKKVARA